MPQVTEIYASLMDDPDVIPPEDVSKEDYALMMAQQRVNQHNNNEKALTLGLAKLLKNTTGTAVNGNGHSPSAVKNFAAFVSINKSRKSEDILEQALLLMLKKGVPELFEHLQNIDHQKLSREYNPIDPEGTGREDSGFKDFYTQQVKFQHPDSALGKAGLTPDLVYDSNMKAQMGSSADKGLRKLFNDSLVHIIELNELTTTMRDNETLEDRLRRHKEDNPNDFKNLEENLKKAWNSDGTFKYAEDIQRLKNRATRLKEIKDWSGEQGITLPEGWEDHPDLAEERDQRGIEMKLTPSRINTFFSQTHEGTGDAPTWTGPALKSPQFKPKASRRDISAQARQARGTRIARERANETRFTGELDALLERYNDGRITGEDYSQQAEDLEKEILGTETGRGFKHWVENADPVQQDLSEDERTDFLDALQRQWQEQHDRAGDGEVDQEYQEQTGRHLDDFNEKRKNLDGQFDTGLITEEERNTEMQRATNELERLVRDTADTDDTPAPPKDFTPEGFPEIKTPADIVNLSTDQLRELGEHHQPSNPLMERYLTDLTDENSFPVALALGRIFGFSRTDMNAAAEGETETDQPVTTDSESQRTPLQPEVAQELRDIYDHTDFAPDGPKEGLEGKHAHRSYDERFAAGEFHTESGRRKGADVLKNAATAFQNGRDQADTERGSGGGGDTEAERLVKKHILDAEIDGTAVSPNAKAAVARAFNSSLEDLAKNEHLVNHLKELDDKGEDIDWMSGASNATAGIKEYIKNNFDVHPQTEIVQGSKVETEPEPGRTSTEGEGTSTDDQDDRRNAATADLARHIQSVAPDLTSENLITWMNTDDFKNAFYGQDIGDEASLSDADKVEQRVAKFKTDHPTLDALRAENSTFESINDHIPEATGAAAGAGTEGDGTEGDGTEGDGTEGDGTEGDGAEGDGEAAADEGDWPEVNDENTRATDDKLRFIRGGIDTAKQYGLMHPNGTYTDLGHKFLDEIGDTYNAATAQIIDKAIPEGETTSPRDRANSYILQKKNEAIRQRNEGKLGAWQKRVDDNDPTKPAGDKPTIENSQLNKELTNYNLQDTTLTNRTITHNTFVSLKNALNQVEGTHDSHEWTASYNPETGALETGVYKPGTLTSSEVLHSENDPFNFNHFNLSDSGRQKLSHALFSNLIGDDLGIRNHEAEWLAHQVIASGGTPKDAAQAAAIVTDNATTEDDDGNIQVDLDTVGGSGDQVEEELGAEDHITSPIIGNGNTPDFFKQTDTDALDAMKRIADTRGVEPSAPADVSGTSDGEGPKPSEELSTRQTRVNALKEVMHEDHHAYLDDPAVYTDKDIDNKWKREVLAKTDKTKEQVAEEERAAAEEGTKNKQDAAKGRTTAAQGRKAAADAAHAEEGEPSSLKGTFAREKMLHRLAGLTGVDTNDPEAMAAFAEEHHEAYYTNNEIRNKVKAAHALELNDQAQKRKAEKTRAEKAKVAKAQIHLNSGRFPSHEEFVAKFTEREGRAPNEEETEAMHTEHAKNLLHYWHDNKEAFIGTEAQADFQKKIHEYLDNGADFKGLSDDLLNMEAQGIDLGDKDARDTYYEEKSYKEKQPELSAEHHAERLRSALTDGHHDRIGDGHMRLGKDGKMEIVPSEEAGRDGGEITHSESSNAPQLQHHKADGTFDEEAQALYQKVHEARQKMNKEAHAHSNALENENSEHQERIAGHKAAHDANVEASEQDYQDAKARTEAVANAQARYADNTHEAGLKEHTQEHEEWDSEISGHRKAHAEEEQRFANTESEIHGAYETKLGELGEWAADGHDTVANSLKAIPEEFMIRRELVRRNYKAELNEMSEQHAQELQEAQNVQVAPEGFEARVQERHDQEIKDSHAGFLEEWASLKEEEKAAYKEIDERHATIDEELKNHQETIKNRAETALQQNTERNQAQHDSMVSALNERRSERGDPLITEGLTGAERGSAGDGPPSLFPYQNLLDEERSAHDASHEAGIARLNSEREATSASIKDDVSEKVGTLKGAKAQRNHESSTALSAVTKESDKQRVANRKKLNDEAPEIAARTKASEEASEALRDHMGKVESVRDDARYPEDDAEGDKPENMIRRGTDEKGHALASEALQNPELGATSEKKKEAHDGDQKGEDRDGSKGQTRMVTDPATNEQKAQVWIPGRGKGWVDKDKMDGAMGSNADAAGDTSSHPDGKVVIYPPGHFNADGDHGDAESLAMVGHGGNLHAVAANHIHPDDPKVAAMGHEDYIANHLAGRLAGHDFSAGVHSGIDAAGLGLHTGDHPATKSAGQRNKEGLGAKFREGEEDAARVGARVGEVGARVGESAVGRLASKVGSALSSDQVFGSEAKRRAGSAATGIDEAKKVFSGASNWLAGKGIGQLNLDLKQSFAETLRSSRHDAESFKGGKYPRGYKPDADYKTENPASLSSELRRLPKVRGKQTKLTHLVEDEAEKNATTALIERNARVAEEEFNARKKS